MCNQMIQHFVDMCFELGVPLAPEKTEWACIQIVFLEILLDGKNMILAIPEDKRRKAINMITKFIESKKATVKELQQLCGYLNFLNKAIHPGRVFMRRMYSKYSQYWNKRNGHLRNTKIQLGKKTRNGKDQQNLKKKSLIKPYHHVRLDREFKADCKVWLSFPKYQDTCKVVNCPMLDLNMFMKSETLKFYSDASAVEQLGFGSVFGSKWLFGQWETELIEKYNPSIEFLELFALCAGILTWQKELMNCRIIIFCDNMSVVNMINNNASKCHRCMYLLRLLILNGLIYNRRISVKHVTSKNNFLADSLSRLDFNRFRRLGPEMDENPDTVNESLLPVSKIILLVDKSQ